jgi:hypothetical protein
MLAKYRLFNRRGVYYTEDVVSREQKSLKTRCKVEALQLLTAKNQAATPNANPELRRFNLVASSETEWEFEAYNPDDPNQQCFFQKDYLERKVFSKIAELGINHCGVTQRYFSKYIILFRRRNYAMETIQIRSTQKRLLPSKEPYSNTCGENMVRI